MIASLMMVTIDRFEITPNVWRQVINAARTKLDSSIQLEFLVCDNGSRDRRIVDFFAGQGLTYHRVNRTNEGVSKAFNQLFLRSTGKFCAILGNDIEMPDGWLNSAIQMLTWVPKGGFIGYDWGHGGVPPITKRFNIDAHWLNDKLNRVFGSMVFRRTLAEDVGLFHEGFGPYGLEDSDLNERANRLGYNSCYLPHMKSKHVGWDVGHQSEYRKMKDESLAKNAGIFGRRVTEWERGVLDPREPLPPLREPT